MNKNKKRLIIFMIIITICIISIGVYINMIGVLPTQIQTQRQTQKEVTNKATNKTTNKIINVVTHKIQKIETEQESPPPLFAKRLSEDYQSLISLSEKVKNLSSEEVHHTPTQLIEGAFILSHILEEVETDPTLTDMARTFFQKCSKNPSIAPSLRKLCHSHTP